MGGNRVDEGYGIALDSAGNAYVTGYTDSTNFPTANPFQLAFGGGSSNAFVTKLNAAGSALVYSPYLGGNALDVGASIAIDSSNNAYVTGWTDSSNFPTTASPFQSVLRGTVNAFVTKLSAAGSVLVYSTYLGGTADDYGLGIAVDSASDAYITGYATAGNLPHGLSVSGRLQRRHSWLRNCDQVECDPGRVESNGSVPIIRECRSGFSQRCLIRSQPGVSSFRS